jgi:excisionase family DNA binding protein
MEATYTTKEAGDLLGFTAERVRQLVKRGTLRGEKDENGEWRVSQSDVDSLQKSRRAEGTRPLPPAVDDTEPESAGVSAKELRDKLLERQLKVAELQGRLESVEQERDRLVRQLEREQDRVPELVAAALCNLPLTRS